MAARIKVDVTLASDEYDWGSPPASEVAICWSASRIHENATIMSKNDGQISSNLIKSIVVNVTNDRGKTKTHTFVKNSGGFINTFILQGDNYYKIGQSNINVPITTVSRTTDSLSWTQSGSNTKISVTQFAKDWVLVKAQGANWGNNNSCGHKKTGGNHHLIRNVNNIYDCAQKNVQAFDYNSIAKTCLLMRSGVNFHPTITSTSGRRKPVTQCYMLKTEYEKVKINGGGGGDGRPPNHGGSLDCLMCTDGIEVPDSCRACEKQGGFR